VTTRIRRARVHVLFLVLTLFFAAGARGQIPGNYTLTANDTFTSIAGQTFTIGGNNTTFNLQTYTATFTGSGDFSINSRITGGGSVLIDMASAASSVWYSSGNGNTYTGLTTVRSGILVLDTPSGANSGIRGDLYIGGGPNLAIVTRTDKQNRELIADTSTITIASNGRLELGRMDTGNAQPHDSIETFGKLILDGGTLLNSSLNTRLTTVNILNGVQLLSSSVIDLGVAMTLNIGDVNTTPWTPGAILTIRDWSPAEPIYIGQITPQQLSQIRFETPTGVRFAQQIADGQIIPSTIVPEASALLLAPLLAAAALGPEIRRRWRAARTVK
jgi:hypothetical protein